MPINRDFVGRVYPAAGTYEVSRSAIRDFATAIGDTNPLYRDPAAARAAGHPDVIAPPTFLMAASSRVGGASPAADPEFGLDYSRVVHGEQRFTAHRPVVPGDVLSMTTRVDDIKDIGSNELVALVTDVTDAAGEPVASLFLSMISRGTAAAKEA